MQARPALEVCEQHVPTANNILTYKYTATINLFTTTVFIFIIL